MNANRLKALSAAALFAAAWTAAAAQSPQRVRIEQRVTIEYEYALDGEIVARRINGKLQHYEYDLRGQLTGVYDGDGKAVESYAYDAAGNILKITVNGKTTSFTYDGANQLVSKEDASGTTTYAYDAAGRMVREGGKEYRYSYLDKITSVVENGETAATMDYFVGGQIASVTRGGDAEKFIWDGLALVHRDGSDYLNEPAVGGGNPIVSNGGVLFNDMLGSTVAVKGDEGYSTMSMTAFGDNGNPDAFFTGKPFVGELGYAFLMRNYRPEHGKWQTADPIGYPDGWNNLAYCNNEVTENVDWFGALIASVYSISKKTLLIYDITTETTLTLVNVISGDNDIAHQWLASIGPVPVGIYYVVDDLDKDNWWELWYLNDSTLDDEAEGPGGVVRRNFRLHPGSRSAGCITVPTSAGTAWVSLVSNTDTIEIDDPYAPWWSPTKRLQYGWLTVVE